MLARALLIVVSACMLLSSATVWIYWSSYRDDLEVERFLCGNFYICANDLVTETAHRQLWSGDPDQMAQAVVNYREALRRNPASPKPWCDLGEAYLQQGEIERARLSFEQAVEHGPSSPPILMRAASFYFSLGENRDAMRHMSRVLELARVYDAAIFSYYDVMDIGFAGLLREGIPGQPEAAVSFFRHLLRKGGTEEVRQAWRWLLERGVDEAELLGPYVDFLLRSQQPQPAVEAQARATTGRGENWHPDQYVFNSGFEHEPLETPLDWRIRPLAGARAARDPEVSDTGAFSLRIDFEGSHNLDFQHVSQRLVARPGRVRLRARIRAAGITTDQGVGLRVLDVESASTLDFRSEPIRGTQPWTTYEESFVVPTRSRLLEIQLIRERSRQIDGKIGGVVWVDGLTLTPLP